VTPEEKFHSFTLPFQFLKKTEDRSFGVFIANLPVTTPIALAAGKEIWGYAPDENLPNEDIFLTKYQGIRPAPGYLACPDNSQIADIFEVLKTQENIGVKLSENYMMYPTASISGFYMANPESKYFSVGKINKEQLLDYAKRKGIEFSKAEKWLDPVYCK